MEDAVKVHYSDMSNMQEKLAELQNESVKTLFNIKGNKNQIPKFNQKCKTIFILS